MPNKRKRIKNTNYKARYQRYRAENRREKSIAKRIVEHALKSKKSSVTTVALNLAKQSRKSGAVIEKFVKDLLKKKNIF